MVQLEELRVRIVKLDNEIDLQRKLLKKLETDRTLALSQLNAALDPMTRLPLEISSEIFRQSVEFWGELQTPILLTSICKTWTTIALSTPALWTAVSIEFPCAKGLAELLPIWFQRAGTRPMSVSMSLRGRWDNWDHSVSDVVWRHGGQLKHLEMTDHGRQSDDEDDFTQRSDIDFLRKKAPTPFPLLDTLITRCFDGSRSFVGHSILKLLRQAPNIIECHLGGTVSYPYFANALERPRLRRLSLGKHSINEYAILRCLSLPSLQALSLPMRSLYINDVMDFFKKSAPPLQELVLGWERYYSLSNSARLHDCLRLIPSLARLKLRGPHSALVTELFAALDNSPSLLPNLSSLIIIVRRRAINLSPVISDAAWSTLLRVVSTRRMQLGILSTDMPAADVVTAFRQLVSDGLDIYIGTKEDLVPPARLHIALFQPRNPLWRPNGVISSFKTGCLRLLHCTSRGPALNSTAAAAGRSVDSAAFPGPCSRYEDQRRRSEDGTRKDQGIHAAVGFAAKQGLMGLHPKEGNDRPPSARNPSSPSMSSSIPHCSSGNVPGIPTCHPPAYPSTASSLPHDEAPVASTHLPSRADLLPMQADAPPALDLPGGRARSPLGWMSTWCVTRQ
ncbi:F-box domain-containing protein [Mycena sanguinolenta]|uniref:F-box domain-containing protein n=1 Tax=Mycena sanguinolenta TaxID=230812 RepID=A0A8H6YP94_9AGAR|nr:F-box domain-containing protein [Mycena sanguinolenta]